MAFKIEEKFEVQAPVERVWQYLIDPKRVVDCLPGAELLEQKDDQTFLGAIAFAFALRQRNQQIEMSDVAVAQERIG